MQTKSSTTFTTTHAPGLVSDARVVREQEDDVSATLIGPSSAVCEDADGAASTSKSTATGATVLSSPAISPPALGFLASFGLAFVYCTIGLAYTLSVRRSKTGKIVYDAAAVVFATEMTKLIVSATLGFVLDGRCVLVELFCSPHRLTLWRESGVYAVSSLIYAVYNNMTFLNLANFDGGTWSVFMQARITVTGVLFTVLLKRALSLRQWASLGLLTAGLTLKFLSPTLQIDYRVSFIIIQAGLSALAGVYNEYVLKKHKTVSIHAQNFFMYLYALFFNIVIGIVVRPDIMRSMDLHTLVNPTVLVIIVSGALMGIAAAFILKFINSIVKTFAAAVESVLVALIGAVLLGDALSVQDIVAILIVVSAIVVYSTTGRGSGLFVHFRRGHVVVNDSP